MNESDALHYAIEGLYRAFSNYPLRPHVRGCEHCVFEEDHARIHSKPLRDLTVDDLKRYASKAMTTWGDEDDFRHFLPRLFELLASDQDSRLFPQTLLGKLGYAGWCRWPKGERASVRAYLTAVWRSVLTCAPFTSGTLWSAKAYICGIACAGPDLTSYLHEWRARRQMSAYCHLAELVGGGRYTVEIEDRFSDFWQGPEVGKEQLIQWLLEPATVEMMDTALEITPTEFVQMLSEARERLIRWQQCDARPRSTP